MPSLTPKRFARLHPVHHMILDFLAQSSPYLVLRLNKHHRLRIIPDLYHTFTITIKSLGAFDCGLTGKDPLLPLAINQAKVLRVVNTESAIFFEHFCPRDKKHGVFPSELKVVRVEFSWAVFRDGYFLRIRGRLGNVGKNTILEQVARSDHLAEALVHVDCGDKWAEHDRNDLLGITHLFGYYHGHIDIDTTIVLHAPNHGRIHFPLGDSGYLPSPFTLRLVLWSTPEKTDETHTGDPRLIPVPSPDVLKAFATFIAISTEDVEDLWPDILDEELEEGFVFPFYIEVVCSNASHVEQLARTLYRPNRPKAEGFAWPLRFRELNEEIVDHYDLWNNIRESSSSMPDDLSASK
ncbi:hypothetical protein B9479_004241 [Cryptococcus floricola]|uniref:Uncharacterized protein n=1 Tax=Cryptococcus floricola TaxID=2591691 RepID=A0A5D3AYE2_9TREE|nr:hypothetical protein B9479_004241 [Cryptococcus floricola]